MTEHARVMRKGEVDAFTWTFADRLGAGETLTGSPVVTIDPPAELAVSGEAVDSPAVTVSYTVNTASAVVGSVYRISASVDTTAGRTLEEMQVIRVVD